jgi:tyrosine-protein kinase Etk/Wzc
LKPTTSTNNPAVESKLIDVKDFLWILKAVQKGWYLLLIIPVIFAAIGAFLAYKKTPVYTTQVQILLKSNDVYDYQTSLYRSVGYSSIYTDIANQKRVIRSYDMIQRSLDGLDFDVSYYIVGRVNTKEFFGNLPFKVDMQPFRGDLYEKVIEFDVLNNQEYQLKFEIDGEIVIQKHRFDEEVITNYYRMITSASPLIKNAKDLQIEAKYEIVVHHKSYWINRIMSSLQIDNEDYTTILNISLQDQIPERSRIFLDSLSSKYIAYTLQNEFDINDNTLLYINKQINEVTQIIDSIVLEIDTIKVKKNVLDIDKEADVYFKQLFSFKEKVRSTELQIANLNNLTDYILATQISEENLLPPSTFVPAGDDYLNEAINKYYSKQLAKINLMSNITMNHKQFGKFEEEMAMQRKDLLLYIKEEIKAKRLEIAEFEEQIDYYEALVKKMPKTAREVQGETRTLNVNEKLYTFLLEKRANTFIAKSGIIPQTKVIEKPRVIAIDKGDFQGQAVKFAMVGLIIALGLSLGKQFLYGTIESSKELAETTVLPVLGSLPFIKNLEIEGVDLTAKSNFSEALRGIRTSLSYSGVGKDVRKILVTSIHPGEGKTFTSTSLAKLYAKSGKKVLIVDFDLHKPKLHKVFGVENKLGNSNYLSGQTAIGELIKELEENVFYITSGPVPPNPSELVMSEKVDELIRYADEHFDYLFIDTPPIGLISDGVVLMSKMDMALFVMNTRMANKRGVKYLEEVVEGVGIKHTGLVLNGVKLKKWRYYYGKYGYGYGYGYGYYGYGYGYGNSPKDKS